MDLPYLAALSQGLSNLFSWPGILIPLLGTVIAMAASFLPGIGIASLSALLILWTIDWQAEQVLLLFGALTGGATFMGSITAILFNVPGNSSAAVVLLDGHALSRQGLPRTAIAAAATASAVGSIFGVIVLLALIPVMRAFILEFGPLERVLLGVWGLLTIAGIPNSSTLKAIAVTLIGLILAMIGTDPLTAAPRWAFGTLELLDGLSVIAVLLGYFTFSELVSWHKDYVVSETSDAQTKDDSIWAGMRAVFTHRWLTMRSAIIGTLVGIIPGVGGTVAGFIAYGHAVQSAKVGRENFGKGDIRGLIAPEAAVDAKDGGSLLPAIAFGLPGSEAGIILVTVLAIHGITPGTPMLGVDLGLTFTLIFALLLSNILTSVVGVTIAPGLARLSYLPVYKIALPVFIASAVSIIHINGGVTDLYVAIALGVLGFLLKHFNWPRVPLVIAFVLGDFFEKNMMITARLQTLGRLNLFEQPAAMLLAAMIILSILWMLRKKQASAPRPMPKPYSAGFAGLLTAAAAGFAVIAFISDGYSGYAQAVVLACAGVLGVAALRDAVAVKATADGPALLGVPLVNAAALMLMAALPIVVWAFGVGPALGVLTTAWMAQKKDLTLSNLALPVIWGGIIGLAGSYYFAVWANLLLPRPAIWTLWP
jgi:putative tricarboxylic transport membrane protein